MEIKRNSRKKYFLFYLANEVKQLAKGMRCLILHKKGYFDIAEWNGKDWYEESTLRHTGGIRGKITKDVIEFAVLD